MRGCHGRQSGENRGARGVWGLLEAKATAFHASVTPPARARKSRVMSRVFLAKANSYSAVLQLSDKAG